MSERKHAVEVELDDEELAHLDVLCWVYAMPRSDMIRHLFTSRTEEEIRTIVAGSQDGAACGV